MRRHLIARIDLDYFGAWSRLSRPSSHSALPTSRPSQRTRPLKSPSPSKWSKKEILGHLIDSAANNHQRFMRLQLQPEISCRDTTRTTGYA